ncbi:MAG: tail fiber domain-containing protein [Bacteroidota bacterium]
MRTFTYLLPLFTTLFFGLQLTAQVSIKPDNSTFDSKVSINDTLNLNGMLFPMSDGNAGQALVTDGDGNLSWENAGGGQNYTSDFEYICYSTTDYDIFNDGSNNFFDAQCGTLYDSGGETGGYGNNEENYFEIFVPEYAADMLLIVKSTDIESGDTLWVDEQAYTGSLATPDTIYTAQEVVYVRFESDNTNNGLTFDGFEIEWSYYRYTQSTYVQEDLLGFFFDPIKQTVGGGIGQDSAWQKVGAYNVLFGTRNEAAGVSSIAIGHINQANSDYSVSIGYDNEANFDHNTVLGSRNSLEGDEGTAIGYFNLGDGGQNTMVGYRNRVDARSGTAIGYSNDAEGEKSSAFGYNNVASGESSTAIGYRTEAKGDESIALGYETDAHAYRMVAVGSYNTRPNSNTSTWFGLDPIFVVGNGISNSSRSNALTVLKSGNVGIGDENPSEALVVNGNIQIGSTEVFSDGGFRTMSVNSNFTPSTDNIRDLGSSSLRWDDIYATNGTVNTSDRRTKTNIKNLNYGLDQIMELRPVRFEWKGNKTGEEKLGLIAQDLLKVLPEVVKTHDWVVSSEEEDAPMKKVKTERLGVYYSDIIPVLISGIQEQQTILEEKEEIINDLEEQVEDLTARLERLEQLLGSNDEVEQRTIQITHPATLAQNHPNPFQTQTTIDYDIPAFESDASIRIVDNQGHLMQRFPIEKSGKGSLLVHLFGFPSGIYHYHLIVDGEILETKKMQVVR